MSRSLLLSVSALAAAAAVWDQTARDCNGRICLTSFQWCPVGDDAGDCSYPDNTYSMINRPNGMSPAILQDTEAYEITWKDVVDAN